MPLSAKGMLIAACFFWSISFIASKVALESVPPLAIVSLRLLISAICFLFWLWIQGRRLPRGLWRHKWQILILSLVGTSLHYGSQTVGLQYTTATNASIYAVTGPISILVISALFLGERLNWKKGAGIAIALSGVLMVMGPERLAQFQLGRYLLGDLLVLFSIILWGVFTVYGKSLEPVLGPLEMTTLVTVMGAITMLPVGGAALWKQGLTLGAVPGKAWLAIGFLGLTCSFLATLLYFQALEKTESQKVGVYLYMIPPMTYLAAALLLGERAGPTLLLGSLLVLGGVYLTERG